jgi:hypothetical protein
LVEQGDDTQLEFGLTPLNNVSVVSDFSPLVSSTTDGTTANKLVDSGASFTTDGILIGAIVKNTTDTTYATITAIDDDNTLSLSADIFISGEDYSILNWVFGGSGTLGTNLTWDETNESVTFTNLDCFLSNPNIATGQYYRVKYSGVRTAGTQRLVFTNGTGLPATTYSEFGNIQSNTGSVSFFKAIGSQFRISALNPFTSSTVTLTDISVVPMSTVSFTIQDCTTGTVFYTSDDNDVEYNILTKYLDNPDAQFYGLVTLDWESYALPDACYCLCVKDESDIGFNYVANGVFTNENYWALFEKTLTTSIPGVVDENGPWRGGRAQEEGNTNFVLDVLNLSRADFNLDESIEWIPTWIGAEVVSGDPRVVLWLDTNTIKPLGNDQTTVTYPDNAIEEYYDSSSAAHYFSPIFLKARLLPGASPEWNPQIHSGWFYDKGNEYYLYADPVSYTATPDGPNKHVTLPGLARQGAPIIVRSIEATPKEYIQIAPSFDEATPTQVTLFINQTIPGTGTDKLYLGYSDVYSVTVKDLDTDLPVTASTLSSTNEITTSADTSRDKNYLVTYRVNRSFIADNDYVASDGTQKTRLEFSDAWDDSLEIKYEDSTFDPATPVDLPLNPLHTIMDEGFIFLSHEEYPLGKVEVRISPSTLAADGADYAIVTLKSLDIYGNPKPNQAFSLSTSWGTLSSASVTTNDDGFATVDLVSEVSDDVTGTLTVTGAVGASLDFEVVPQGSTPNNRLVSIISADAIPADDFSTVYIYGKVEDPSYAPIPYAVVYWRKGRYMYDVFTRAKSEANATPGQSGLAGAVTADAQGKFEIGPFVAATPSEPGYWFVATETDHTTPSVTNYTIIGDVVAWLEYPDAQFGIENSNLMPPQLVQWGQQPTEIPGMTEPYNVAFPVTWDDWDPYLPATPISLVWRPPTWYGIDKHTQYQLGLLSDTRDILDPTKWQTSHPDYKEF